jgi:hypothetical protein
MRFQAGTTPTQKPMKNSNATNSTFPKLFSRKDLAVRWNCSIETLKRREKSGILNPTILGRLVRYRLEEIEAVEAAGATKSVR